jgi:hypothetical protein
MYPQSHQNQVFYNNLVAFIKVAQDDMLRKGETKICCPCSRCRNLVMFQHGSSEVHHHLLQHGFMEGYTRWTSHGEEAIVANGKGGMTMMDRQMHRK